MERPPFVWIKPDTHGSFGRVPLKDLFDVADLAAAAAASLGVAGNPELILLTAQPSPQPPPPDAIAAALLLGSILPVTADLLGAGVVAGCWLLARIPANALALERQARMDAEAALVEEKAARAAAEAARAAAEADRAAAEAARAAAEADRTAAEAARAAAEAKAARERELANKRAFLALMLSISSACSGDTASHADEARQVAPLPQTVTLEAVLCALPPAPSPSETSLAWKAFAHSHARMALSTRRKLDENRDVHPTIRLLLSAALGQQLRLWCNALAEDDVAKAKIRPDFTVTHARDSIPSTIGALLLVEVKLPGELPAACAQARAYLRRSIFKRCSEADARGESMDGIFAYALATDGISVVALRMLSGAPPPGASFEGALPCPVVESPALPLLHWDFLSKPPAFHKKHPPEGFAALHRLCAAPAAALAAETILVQLSAQLLLPAHPQQGEDGDGGQSSSTLLALGARLGCGGSSDGYECTAELSEAAAEVRAPLAVKVSRFTTETVQACFARERTALLALEGAAARGLVPRLIASGARQGGAANWPLLLLQPCGQSLPSWVAECVAASAASSSGGGGGGSSGGGGGSAGKAVCAARAACASAVVKRLLDALEAAHAASLVHCDVRPSNVVVVRGAGAMLVDWGISRASGEEARDCGVAAYADRRVFEQGSYQARPAQDVTGALLTWLCVAHSEQCDAPWRTTGALETLFDARAAWLTQRSGEDAAVAGVVAALRQVEERRSWAGSESALYALARRALSSGV